MRSPRCLYGPRVFCQEDIISKKVISIIFTVVVSLGIVAAPAYANELSPFSVEINPTIVEIQTKREEVLSNYPDYITNEDREIVFDNWEMLLDNQLLLDAKLTKLSNLKDELEARKQQHEEELARLEAERLAQEEAERIAAEEAARAEAYYYNYSYSEPSYSYSSGGSTNDFASAGVIYQDGNRYTYYSSNVLYHYRTPEWTAGSDGIYRDSDGYVVVAANPNQYGYETVVSTPFGDGKVYDSGVPQGTVDIYVNY